MMKRLREWECRHSVLKPWSEKAEWKCNFRKMFSLYAKSVTSGCWATDCIHNADGHCPEFHDTDKANKSRGLPPATRCPFASAAENGGKCEKMCDDGSFRWCQQGERKTTFDSSDECLLGYSRYGDPHPLFSCSLAVRLTKLELLEMADIYFDYLAVRHGKKIHYSSWFIEMLKAVGAPKVILERPISPWRDKHWRDMTDDDNRNSRTENAKYNTVWRNFYTAERKRLLKEREAAE